MSPSVSATSIVPLGILEGDTVTWYWIGKHDTYDRKLD